MQGKVLITGSAGLLGGEITGLMVDRGYDVIGLVNRNPEIRRNNGSEVTGVARLSGDITKAAFGLADAAAAAFAEEVELVIHCAAVTDFTAESDLHRNVNIGGTETVLDFCRAADAKLLHISTAYVAGDREGKIKESELDEGQGFTNGYESTKFEAEKRVRASDVDWAIARPSIVLGDHAEGRTRSFDTIYPILKVFAEGWVKTMPASANATLDLVPIDHVTRGIVAMAERFDEARGRVFHLVSSEPTPLTAFPKTLSSFKGLSYPQWTDPESFDLLNLRPAERRFFQRGAEVYARYFTRNPRFCDLEFQAFAGAGCPPTDEAWWQRVVAYAIDAGFIRVREKENA